jgi:hypothetical protein
MKFKELQKALSANSALTIKKGQVQIGSDSLDETLPAGLPGTFYGADGIAISSVVSAASDPRRIVVNGKASFPLLSAPTDVLAAFELVGDPETLALTLRYKMPPEWRFVHSFPDLPITGEFDNLPVDFEHPETVLDSFKLTNRFFYWTTYPHEWHDDDLGGSICLDEGLTFAGRWTPDGMLGVLEKVAKSANAAGKILYGPVILDPAGPPLPLRGGQLPWDTQPRIPGIHLHAGLGFDLTFPPDSQAGMKLAALRFQIYSPFSFFPPEDVPEYSLVMGYAGDLYIPSFLKGKEVGIMTAVQSVGPSDQLVIGGAFTGLTLEDLAASLKDLAGGSGDSSIVDLPPDLSNALSGLGLTNASITLSKSETGYEVGVTEFTIGVAQEAKPWSLFGDLIALKFEGLTIGVIKPFSTDERAVFATLAATTKFMDIELYVEVQYPGFYLSARQVGIKTVNFDYFKKQNINLPKILDVQFKIADIVFEAEPGAYYSFSMRLAPGTEWKIQNQYTLPDLRLSVRGQTPKVGAPHLSWRFGARTNLGDKAVPVLALMRQLSEDVVKIPEAPAALESLSIRAVDLAYDSASETFAFECRGQLEINNVALECGFIVAHRSGPNAQTLFGGEVLLRQDDRPPLSFSLQFGSGDDSKYCLATYYDAYGESVNVQSLAKSVLSPKQVALIPASLKISLRSALLAYSQQGQGGNEESTVLFGADLGASIKLSDLPIVGSALPADMTIGFESLRVMVASASLGIESVKKLNGLFPAGMKPLPGGAEGENKGLAKGFNISVVLLFGKEPRTLTLPIAEDKATQDSATPQVQPAAQPAAQPGSPPAATPSVTADSVKWFEIEKSLGPLTVRRIGVLYEDQKVGIKFDASLALSVLTFNLEGLGLRYALKGSTEPSEILKNLDFTLDGMGLSLGSGPIEIGGSLVRVPGDHLELNGALLIRTAAFSFSALGSYVDLNGTISVMAFAVLLKELGDPTGTGAFVVTGLAFGFGVNRKLKLPTIEQVRDFPLIQAAMGKQDLATVASLPVKLRDYVSPSAGDFWIAAGIKVNSFVVLDSFLLLSVSWGAEIEIGLLGLSRMTMPPLVQPEQAIASAELALRGVIRIAEGLIQFEARLTENSFIFSKACRLTGGFAFCVWFAGPHAGDFIVSLGGYHPAFVRPPHYPLVPRLGMQLQIGKELSITGEAYFALTTSCVMAGGKLCAVFKSGGIEAWFIAYADFLMNWQPFYYQAAMGITLGIALRLGSLVLRLELSVELKLQGPPFGGEARVTLWIISFTIPFGTPAAAPPPLTAGEFVNKCLPKSSPQATSPDIFSVRITGGLIREQEVQAEKRTARIVNAHRLSLSVQSVIPCTEFAGLGKGTTAKTDCGIRSMGKTKLQSVLSVTVNGIDAGKQVKISPITGNVPDAMWGKSEKEGIVPTPRKPETKTIDAALGVRIESIPLHPVGSLAPIPISKLTYEVIPKRVDWHVENLPAYTRPTAKWTDNKTIWTDNSVNQRRLDVLKFLRQDMPDGLLLNEPHLERLSANQDYFQQQPEMNAVGY